MYPTLEKIKEIAQSGEYRRIPVCRELYSDRYTPVEVMRTLRTATIFWKVPARQRYGGSSPSWDMNRSWRSPVQMENFRSV